MRLFQRITEESVRCEGLLWSDQRSVGLRMPFTPSRTLFMRLTRLRGYGFSARIDLDVYRTKGPCSCGSGIRIDRGDAWQYDRWGCPVCRLDLRPRDWWLNAPTWPKPNLRAGAGMLAAKR